MSSAAAARSERLVKWTCFHILRGVGATSDWSGVRITGRGFLQSVIGANDATQERRYHQ